MAVASGAVPTAARAAAFRTCRRPTHNPSPSAVTVPRPSMFDLIPIFGEFGSDHPITALGSIPFFRQVALRPRHIMESADRETPSDGANR
jgi:hypothetical protein